MPSYGLGNESPPPTQLVAILAMYRERGFSFELAWNSAMDEVRLPWDARPWREVLNGERIAFEAAYRGELTAAAETFATLEPMGRVEIAS